MSKKKQQIASEEKDWERIGEAVVTSERFLEKYLNQILIGIGVIVLIGASVWAYNHWYLEPKNKEAQAALFKGQRYFEARQDSIAIYGDGNGYIGFEAVIREYGSTKSGNLAHYYAGVSYSRLGKYEQAIAHLKDFSTSDDIVSAAAKGVLGDCLDNTGKTEEAAGYFVEAAQKADNNLQSPIYYKKAGLAYLEIKKYDKAIEVFTTLKNNFFSSTESADADKYIEEAKLLKGK
ncbi:MAG: tetratricopeptide repeat protein [Prevotella sp.]|jgi:tetratricopeptide (TPR) repeat protein|nr:tetratricopeptide repeat protein [Prevotella sp.]